MADPGAFLGVDLGIANIATDDGAQHGGKNLNRQRHRARHLQAKLQAKDTKSAKRLKAEKLTSPHPDVRAATCTQSAAGSDRLRRG